ncbi:ABC transporter substrate-binding protein [Burkholderia sp. Ac-20379]|uniref:ABC transporter substrate-binding protein n=1 Tax=Burkholderia sp. Ac-20379 TaxID=2703900 RepID=UPI0019806888|nr:ABC transporter substrate-binding protein [Burkholderia sp. Ac-20379]MBN3727096.1 ABC transporter substrate-binding protein [Burkholderia sp. Ac-20379]
MKDRTTRIEARSRRTFLGRTVAAGGLLLGGIPALAATRDSQTLHLGVIGPTRAPTGPSGYALALGYLQRELSPLGIHDISVHVFRNGPDLNEALFAGALDIGIYGDTPALVARGKGVGAHLIGFEEIGLSSWLVAPKGGVQRVADLDGKTVGVAMGSYTHRYLLGVLGAAGLSNRTRVVYLLGSDADAALHNASLDAYAAASDFGPVLAERGYPVIDQGVQHPDLLGSYVIVASDKLLARVPGVAQAWHRARRAALSKIGADAPAYYAFHQKQTAFTADTIRLAHPVSHFPTAAYPPEGLALLDSARRFLLDRRLISDDFTLKQWQA